MTDQQRRLALIVAGLLLVLFGVGFSLHELTQPEPNTERCAALVGPGSTDAERERAFQSPLCKDVREAVR